MITESKKSLLLNTRYCGKILFRNLIIITNLIQLNKKARELGVLLPNVHTKRTCTYRISIITLMVINASIRFVLAFFYFPGLGIDRHKKRVPKTWLASLNN